MRYKLRKDRNHNDILDAFRKCGCSVFVLHTPCDAIIGMANINVLIEIKDGDKSPSKRKLTETQLEFFQSWRGWVAVVIDENDVLKIVNQIRQEATYSTRGFMASAPGGKFEHEPLMAEITEV